MSGVFCANVGNQSWQVWVIFRGHTMMAESKMAKFKKVEFKMAANIKLSQNEWVEFFCANGGNQSWQVWVSLKENTMMVESKMAKFKMAEFKMAAIIKLSENEWAWVRLNLFESASEWSESVFEWIWEKITRCLNPRWQCLNPTW